MIAKRTRRVRKHWYRLHIGECPVCGRDQSYRERVYGRKPSREKRYVYLPQAACCHHFM